MCESVVFFSFYRDRMLIIRDFAASFPVTMIDYILGRERNPSPSGCLNESSKFIFMNEEETFSVTNRNSFFLIQVYYWNINCYFCIALEFNEWPTAQFLGLDQYQHRALYEAMTSSLCLIQGGPGTGKRFMLLKILDTLLKNRVLSSESNDDHHVPIVVLFNKVNSLFNCK